MIPTDRRSGAASFIGVLLFLILTTAASGEEGLILFDSDAPEWRVLSDDIDGLGGRFLQAFPPGGAIVDGDLSFWERVDRERSRWTTVRSSDDVDVDVNIREAGVGSAISREARFALAAWNRRLNPPTRRSSATGPPFIDDAAPGPRGSPGVGKAPPGGNFFDTSEFFLGSVAIGILLPESDGTIDPSTEDWTVAMIDSVIAEVQTGLAWWIPFAPGGELSFVFEAGDPVPTPYEPIIRPAFAAKQESIWVKGVFDTLGYETGDTWFRSRSYLNDLRETYGTDWAVAVFVANSKNDADGKFSNSFYGFSYYGGPYFVMTYDNADEGIEGMHAVAAHEIAHSFYALDEYWEAHKGCTLRLGYTYEENQNSEYGICNTDDPCIMRDELGADYDSNAVCYYTLRQIGMGDADVDGVADLLDTHPSTTLEASPDSTADTTPAFAGSSWVNPVTNLNTYGEMNDITLNTIALVEYRIDGGDWIPADAGDGVFDSAGEAFTFTTEALYETLHTFDVRAVNTAGNADTLIARDTIYIYDGTAPAMVADLAAGADDSTAILTWVNPGDSDLQTLMIRYSTVACPADTTDGILLETRAAAPSAADTLVHAGLFPDTTYLYAFFSLDEIPNVSGPACVTATPLYPPPPVTLYSPAPGSLHVGPSALFRWSAVGLPDPADTLSAYEVQIALDSFFTALVADTEATVGAPADTLWNYGVLDGGSLHWWRVRGKDQLSGTYGYWSDPSAFATELLLDEIVFLDSTLSAYTNFASGDSLSPNSDGLVEARLHPADTLGIGGYSGWVHWNTPGADSSALVFTENEGGYGYYRSAIPYGGAFERGDTVTFSVSALSPNQSSLVDDQGGAGYLFVAGRRAVPAWHVPESVEPVTTMRSPINPIDTDTATAFSLGFSPAGTVTGGELVFRVFPDPVYGSAPLAPDTAIGDTTWFLAMLDSTFFVEDLVEYYIRAWGDSSWDTTFVYGANDLSYTATVPASALASPYTFLVQSVTGVAGGAGGAVSFVPVRNELSVNRPNPFNPTTTIPFALSSSGRVILTLFDTRGRVVRILVDEERPAGWHTVIWDGRTSGGGDAASGVYFAVVSSGAWRETLKMLLLR